MRKKLPTIADVASNAGVSPMTVSRVINGEERVKPATKDLVVRSIKKLGYVPNISARALAGARSFKLGLLYENPSSFYLSGLVVGALEAASERGHQLLLHKMAGSESADAVAKSLDDLLHRFDGVIVPPPISDYPNVRDFIHKQRMAAVMLSGDQGKGRNPKISIDDYAAAAEMTRYLVERGHSRIGFIKGHPNQFSSELRLQGYRDALSEVGLKPNRYLIVQGYFSYQSGLAAAKKLLRRKVPPTAIFASNDDMAAATLGVASSLGIRVPQDLSVAGFDDSPIASSVYPNLTTVKQPLAEMAMQAVYRLAALIDNSRAGTSIENRHVVMPYEIVRRRSTAKC